MTSSPHAGGGLGALAEAVRTRPISYLLTVGDGPYPHAVAVTAVLDDGVVRIDDAGRTCRTHVAAHGGVSLLWPPAEPGGYSLIVDADAELDGDLVRARPRRAVLHRARAGPAPEQGCAADCVEILRVRSPAPERGPRCGHQRIAADPCR